MILLKLPVWLTSEPKIYFIFARSSLWREGIWQLASSPILHSQLWRRNLIGHKAALWQETSVSNADSRGQSWQCCIKVKVNIFRANLFLSFLSCEDQTVFYAIYNLSSLVFFDPFNDGWHEQDLNKEWNPNVSRGGVSLKFRFRAVSYLSWLGSGWVFWDPKSKTFGTQKNWEFLFPQCGISWTQNVEVGRPKCAFDFILVPRSRGYTWSSLHKWQ